MGTREKGCRTLFGLALLAVVLAGPATLAAGEPSAPEKAFDCLWRSFDANYALFPTKHVDWQALYKVYRPRVNAATTDEELFAAMSGILGHLNDNHVRLISPQPFRFFSAGWLFDRYGTAGIAKFQAFMGARPVPARYFPAPLRESANGIFAHGWLADGIGYVHFNAFDDAAGSARAMDEILAEFRTARALIVDVRRNGGGDDQVGKLLANRFADRKRLYMTSRDRNGPRHGDLDPVKRFFVEPAGPFPFTGPVILLTNRHSVSAAENFALAMRILPHVTVVGDFTSGCFADNYTAKLPNGWTIGLSMNLFLDCHGFCWEGIGVPPDIKVQDDYDSPERDRDPILETALDLIRSGPPARQDDSEGVPTAESLARLLAGDIRTMGADRAAARCARRYAGDRTGRYYLDAYELLELAGQLDESGQEEAGRQVLTLAGRLFPEMADPLEQLGFACLKGNRNEEAAQAFQEAISRRKPKLSPYARQFQTCLGDELAVALARGGSAALAGKFRSLRDEYPDWTNEGLVNSWGYELLGRGLAEQALPYFTLNTEQFPGSSNAWDSLGEALAKAGKKEEAVRSYEKSLQLNPKSRSATEALKKLRGDR